MFHISIWGGGASVEGQSPSVPTGLVKTSVNSGLLWSSCCCYHVEGNRWKRFRYEKKYVWCKFMWFASNCEAVGEGLLYIANLEGLKNVTIGKELLQCGRGTRSWYFAHLAESNDSKEKVSKEENLEIKKIQGYRNRSPSNFGWLGAEVEILVPVPQI